MANDIEIRVTGTDTSGPALAAAARNAKSLRDLIDQTGVTARSTSGDIRRMSGELDVLASSSADAGNEAKESSDKYRALTREIKQTRASIRELAAEVDRVGGKSLFGRTQQSTKAKDLLPNLTQEGSKGAQSAAAGFVNTLPKAIRGYLASGPGAVLGGLVAAGMAPTLSAAVAGAVVGGVGAGGVIGGVVIAAKDSRVQAAGRQLGATITADLERSGARFVRPTIRGIQIIQGAWNDVADDVDESLAAASRYVEPLARGVAGFGRELAPGLRKAAEAAEPIVAVIREDLPKLGRAISDVMSDFADDADEGAAGVRWLFQIMEGGIRTIGGVVHGFAQMFRAVVAVDDVAIDLADHLWGWNPLFKSGIDDARKKIDELKATMEKSGESGKQAGDTIADGLFKVDEAAAEATAEVKSFSESVRTFVDDTLGARAASRGLEEAIDAATEAAAENGRTLDENTPKGRANAAALDDIAAQGWAAYEATKQLTGSQGEAEEKLIRAKTEFIRVAQSMGMSAAEAKRLADQLFALPPKVDVTVTAITSTATGQIIGFEKKINKLDGRVITVRTRITSAGEYIPGVGTQTRAHGGITGAANGGLRGALTWVGEQGPELLELPPSTTVHSAADSQRMLSGGGGGRVEVVLSVAPGADSGLMRELVKSLRYEVRDLGGNVQLALGT